MILIDGDNLFTVFPVDDDEPMAEYIRKDTARRIIDSPRNREQMLAMLDAVPSEDVQPVVRCKDCNDYQTKFRWCKLHDGEMQPTDFCSYGERKDGEHGWAENLV